MYVYVEQDFQFQGSELEHFKKYRSHWNRSFLFLASFRLSHSPLRGCFFAKASPKTKNPRFEWPRYFLKCSGPGEESERSNQNNGRSARFLFKRGCLSAPWLFWSQSSGAGLVHRRPDRSGECDRGRAVRG